MCVGSRVSNGTSFFLSHGTKGQWKEFFWIFLIIFGHSGSEVVKGQRDKVAESSSSYLEDRAKSWNKPLQDLKKFFTNRDKNWKWTRPVRCANSSVLQTIFSKHICCESILPKVPFIYYVSTCIAQNLIWLPNFSQKLGFFFVKTKQFLFPFWQNLMLKFEIFST